MPDQQNDDTDAQDFHSCYPAPPVLLHILIPSLILLPLRKVDVRVIKPPFRTLITR